MADFNHIQYDTRKIAGHTFKVCKEPLQLPYLRKCGYYIAMFDMGRKASTADLLAFVDMAKDYINKGNLSDMGALVAILESNLQLYTSFGPVFDMASCIILVDDEPWKEIPNKHHELKFRLCGESEEVADFFLTSTLALLASSNNDLDTAQIQKFLKSQEHKVTNETFLDSIETLRKRTSPSDLIKKHFGYPSSQEYPSKRLPEPTTWPSITRWLKRHSQ